MNLRLQVLGNVISSNYSTMLLEAATNSPMNHYNRKEENWRCATRIDAQAEKKSRTKLKKYTSLFHKVRVFMFTKSKK